MRKLNILEMNRLTVDEFREAEKLPLVVVLDDVRSLYNVGSVFRTCDAFRVEAVYLCGITATPPHNEIHKTALGAEDSVAWRHFKTADEAVAELKRQNFTVYAVEQAEGSVKLPFSIENPSSKLEKSPSLPLHSPFSLFQNRPHTRPRSQGRQPERCRCLRRLFGDSAVRHETFAECFRCRRHRHLGICPPFLRSESRKNRLKTQKNRSKLTSETVTMSNSLRVG